MDGRDAWASPPMIALDMMDEYVFAHTERLQDKFGDKVITRGNWEDAKSGDIERFVSKCQGEKAFRNSYGKKGCPSTTKSWCQVSVFRG
jgi:hypothetical protein